jgi:hypothetical protein
MVDRAVAIALKMELGLHAASPIMDSLSFRLSVCPDKVTAAIYFSNFKN